MHLVAKLLVAVSVTALLGFGGFKIAQEVAVRNRSLCLSQLAKLEEGKRKWAEGLNKKNGAAVDEVELNGMVGGPFNCPSGGLVDVNKVGHPPTCTKPGHSLSGAPASLTESIVSKVPRDP